MHAAARRGLRSASRHKVPRPCRYRKPTHITQRTFTHSSTRTLNLNPFSSSNQAATAEHERSAVTPAPEEYNASEEVAEAREAEPTTETTVGGGRDRHTGQTAAARRNARNRRPKELPVPVIPQWFYNNNVKLYEDDRPFTEGILELTPRADTRTEKGTYQVLSRAERTLSDANITGKAEHFVQAARQAQDGSEDNTQKMRDAAKDLEDSLQTHGKALESMISNLKKDQSVTEDEATASGHQQPSSNEEAAEVDSSTVTTEGTYRLNEAVMQEIIVSIAAGLSSAQSEASASFPSAKSHIRLHCPVDNCEFFLEKIVDHAAIKNNADIIRLDAQDLAEIAGDYIKEGRDTTTNALWTLGYDVQEHGAQAMFDQAEEQQPNEEVEDDTNESDVGDMPHRPSFSAMAAMPVITFERAPASLHEIVQRMSSFRDKASKASIPSSTRNGVRVESPAFAAYGATPNPSQQWNDIKLGALIEALLETNQNKRTIPSLSDASAPSSRGIAIANHASSIPEGSSEDVQTLRAEVPSSNLPKTIVLVRGFKELCATQQGCLLLDKLLEVVQKRQKHDGQQIMIIGATSSSALTPELSKRGIEGLQGELTDSVYRTIVVTPPNSNEFDHDERRLIREVNARHLRDMARRLSPNTSNKISEILDVATFNGVSDDPDIQELASILDQEGFLGFDEVHRLVLTASGMLQAGEELEPRHLISAAHLIEESDGVKETWVDDFRAMERQKDDESKEAKSAPEKNSPGDLRLKQLRKTCNHHEKVMLRGVVNPENIRTTFKDVHAPAETIEALRTMTMLSLTRPEAFTYGVLATDKLPGALLYGPPGTGKTLLAKAVAKESGATVLEVSGSDVYDMYVGEAEKNVRAIFTLARKLAPCVVFIDEADAIFAARGSNQRNTHRELINQFLREWDGMNETNAFLMLATNRPFDLDDAALRRLPRRLLVDLPVEKDREAILKIHLRDEQVDSNVSLSDLAQQTPLYSGSDLKNLAVAAALSAVREENEDADMHTGKEAYVYPEKRVLKQRHFDKAIEEITASVGEDMSSLNAIKKFDEKYGDRKGKKKRTIYGFAGAQSIKELTNKVRA